MDKLTDIYYLRLSKEDGDTEYGTAQESCSIQSQRTCVHRFLRENGFDVNAFTEITDDGYTGTTMNRPGMNKLTALVQAGKVRTVIVRDLSRFARNYLDAGYYLEFVFPAYNVRFISINDRFDSMKLGEMTGGLDLAIRNLINQMYSKDISGKIKSAVDIKKLSGEFVYGTAPYGYKKGEKKNTIVVDEDAAAIVKEIFEWAASGITVTNIAKRLNRAMITTPSVYLSKVRGNYKVRTSWSYESVRNILTNRIYTGDTVPFKSSVVRVGSSKVKQIPPELRQIVPDTHDAIVSRELFSQAQGVIKTVKKQRGRKSENPFTSLLVCGCCGNKLSKGKKTNRNWMCSMHRYDPSTDCKNVRIDEERLSEIVLNAIKIQCGLLDAKIRKIQHECSSAKSTDQVLKSEIKSVRRQIESIEDKKMELYERYVSGGITKDMYLSEKKSLSAEEEQLKVRITVAKQKLNLACESRNRIIAHLSEGEKIAAYQEIKELTPELTKELIKKIVIQPDSTIRIEWNFSDELSGIAGMTEPTSEKQAI